MHQIIWLTFPLIGFFYPTFHILNMLSFKIPALRMCCEHKIQTLTRKLFAIYIAWTRKIIFLKLSLNKYINHILRQSAHHLLATKLVLNFVFVEFVECLLFFYLILVSVLFLLWLCCLFICINFNFFQGKDGEKWSSVGKEGEDLGEFRDGKCGQNILHKN